ncbi:MAG: hypothetical protein O7J95_10415 [Planctomycetota bacterium]|nr:hypothetical protein [Planctomycetota bacterium]
MILFSFAARQAIPDDDAGENRRELLVGAATSNITPPLGEPIVGGWSPFPATNIHDELHARCLALDDGKTRVVLVVCDNVGMPREVFDRARKWLAEETELAPESVLMCATHTHSATSARGKSPLGGDPLEEYARFLARRIADGVRRALTNLEPAQIGWGSANAPEHVFNRRWLMKPGPELDNPFGGTDRVRMNPPRNHPNLIEPAGPTDPEVSFISLRSTSGRPIALLANYSLHYVGGVPGGDVSADYFALFADRIQELLGADRQSPPFVGIITNGTSGDINNINFRGPREKLPAYEKMRRVARDVAEKVFRASRDIAYRDWVPLGVRMRELTLRTRKPSAALLARAREILGRREDVEPRHPREVIYAHRMIAMSLAPDRVSVPLQVLRIGDLGVAAIPFEVFVDTGLEIKRRTPFSRSFTISLANGSYGYLPTPEHHRLGGYETWLGTSRVELEASRRITDTLLEMMAELEP